MMDIEMRSNVTVAVEEAIQDMLPDVFRDKKPADKAVLLELIKSKLSSFPARLSVDESEILDTNIVYLVITAGDTVYSINAMLEKSGDRLLIHYEMNLEFYFENEPELKVKG